MRMRTASYLPLSPPPSLSRRLFRWPPTTCSDGLVPIHRLTPLLSTPPPQAINDAYTKTAAELELVLAHAGALEKEVETSRAMQSTVGKWDAAATPTGSFVEAGAPKAAAA